MIIKLIAAFVIFMVVVSILAAIADHRERERLRDEIRKRGKKRYFFGED